MGRLPVRRADPSVAATVRCLRLHHPSAPAEEEVALSLIASADESNLDH